MVRVAYFVGLIAAASLGNAQLLAQSPAPSAPATPAKPSVTPTPSPAIAATPARKTLIDAMDAAELQQAISLLKTNFIDPAALNEIELKRATLEGLLVRLDRGAVLLPAQKPADPVQTVSSFYNEIFDGHIGYLRLGALTSANLQAMDSALKTFASKKVDALIIDLRASPATNDFETAAEFAKRFGVKGKPLFTLRKLAAKQDRLFSSDRDPAFAGMMIALTDTDTAGAGEALAGVLRSVDKAMIIGAPTAGRAVEYSDLPLSNGKILRVAVAEVLLPDGKSLFPEGLKPDVPVEMTAAEKRAVFEQSKSKGMSQFVFEKEHPHFNEAALLAGTNPEIGGSAQARGSRTAEKAILRDPVVQRAVDLVMSLEIYQKR